MIDNIDAPAAWADVRWFSAAEGGRSSGPPTADVYAANCAFPLGGELELVPGWPATAESYSVLVQKLTERDSRRWRCALDFFAHDLVANFVTVGAQMLIMEGPKVVGEAVITEVDEDVLRH